MESNLAPVQQVARHIPGQESGTAPAQGTIVYVEFRLRDGTSIFVPMQETLVPVD